MKRDNWLRENGACASLSESPENFLSAWKFWTRDSLLGILSWSSFYFSIFIFI